MSEITIVNDKSIIQRQQINDDLVKKFESYIDVRTNSKTTYIRAIKQFLSYLKDNAIYQPTRTDIIAWRDDLKKDHKASTIQNYLTAIKLFFRFLQQEGIYQNIADHVKAVKIEKGYKKDYLTSAQGKRVLEMAQNSNSIMSMRNYAIIALMLTTGLRTIEVSRANIEDMRTVGDSTVLYIQGKGRDDKNEYVKIAPPVETAIREYLMKREAAAADEPLFTSTSHNNQGQRLTTRTIRDICKKAMQKAGYDSDRLTAHSLRHTAATQALMSGATLRQVQEMMRHRNINTTLIYMHDLDRQQNNAELLVANALFQ